MTSEEELALLIAEQEKDAAYGDRINYSRDLSLDKPLGVGEGASTLAEIVGEKDGQLTELIGDEAASQTRWIGRPQKWTRRQIISHIRAWVKEHGEPPDSDEWNAPRGRGFPSTASVRRHFGTFNEAIIAAGFEPRKIGGCTPQTVTEFTGRRRVRKAQRSGSRLTSENLSAAYVLYQKGMSFPQLADLLWERYGYPSPVACKGALNKGFHYEGFRVRTKSEARMLLTPEHRKEIAAKARSARDWSPEKRKQTAQRGWTTRRRFGAIYPTSTTDASGVLPEQPVSPTKELGSSVAD